VDNGVLRELGDFSYLLSPQDLCGLDHVPALLRAGVSCLKIEGRLKDAAYVAATTRAYRNAVDQAWKAYQDDYAKASGGQMPPSFVRPISLPDESVSRVELAQLFSRGQDENHDGLSPGFFDGSRHQQLVRGRSPRHRGVHLGRVLEGSSWKKGLFVALDGTEGDKTPLKRGDGLVVDRGLAQGDELGGPIFDIQILPERSKGKQVAVIRFSTSVEKKWKQLDEQARKVGAAQPEHAPAGAHVWKTSDATVDKKMKRLSEAPAPKPHRSALISVKGSIGSLFVVTIQDEATGRKGVGTTESHLQPAAKVALDDKSIRKAIGTLGNTDWELSAIDTTQVEPRAWCPTSWIKECRRQAVEDLKSQFISSESMPSEKDNMDDGSPEEIAGGMTEGLLGTFIKNGAVHHKSTRIIPIPGTSRLSVLARNYAQVDTVCKMIEDGQADIIDEIIVDFLEVDGMRDAVNRIHQVASARAVVASPRIIKPGEAGIWKTLLRLQPDGLLVRSTGLLKRMMKLGGQGAVVEVDAPESNSVNKVVIPELIGDFSLNVANPLSAWELLSYGCSRVTASFDLNANGITELLESMGSMDEGASRVDIVAHAHLPIFHTEHCVFARFLTNGNSYLDCGHACTQHNVHLRDQTGADNLVLGRLLAIISAICRPSLPLIFSLGRFQTFPFS
jgi:U32 family peptidase